ncbi:antiviral reverse transcriptase Drt3a [Xylanibacter ruminicola]|uniref:antiviral reverse transcriptase Drt3a n=1 Tax=Xylanibacter ruminicola TaxID=839 RepID=UPI000490D0B8|nr:antiviral reverse transcriptase Drt3a [Xylanibacter ruminicola]
MLDQSFTAYHFNEIFQIERRKGNIRKEYFPEPYLAVLEEGHRLNDVIRELKSVKRTEWTDEQKQEYKETKEAIKENQKERRKEESKWLEVIADKVNDPRFRITLDTIDLDDKTGYTVPNEVEYLFVMKTLQANLKKVFKVQQANRHRIMTQVKRLMNESTPKYIIRTDVHHFYESILQDRLLEMLKGNTLLSKMSVRFIWQILEEYERKKDTEEPKGLGVPRGVGVSAYLSEIYLRGVDESIKHRPEVVFYVRYVDDIFIILSHLPIGTTLEEYYDGLRDEFAALGLSLMDPNNPEQKKKLLLEDFHTYLKNKETKQGNFNYLGYNLKWLRSGGESGTRLITKFGLSDDKKKKLFRRLNNAFVHFEEKTKYSLSEARMDLRDSLRMIAGNYRLTKSKSGIKAGIYYSNDLLTEVGELKTFTKFVHNRKIKVYSEVLKGMPERDQYIAGIKAMVKQFDFQKSWKERKCYTMADKRIREISQWLSKE